MSLFLSKIREGGQVVRCTWNYGQVAYFVSVVRHITLKGFINVDGVLFRPDEKAGQGNNNCLAQMIPMYKKRCWNIKRDGDKRSAEKNVGYQ